MASVLHDLDHDVLQKQAAKLRTQEWHALVKDASPTMSERMEALDSAIEIERAVLRVIGRPE